MKLPCTGWLRLAVLLMLPVQAMGQAESGNPGDLNKKSPDSFSCTQVLGFSQSLEWYGGLSLADYTAGEGPPEPPSLEGGAFLPTWQGAFYMGAAVEKWTDLEFPAWSGTHDTTHEMAAHCGRDQVDRVVFNVSGAARSPDEWASAVESVAELIREKFPAARQIVMQPVVGAPEGKCREVRAARNHPDIAEGIRRSAERSEIIAGPSPEVASCAQFRDDLGHLTKEGAEHVRQALKAHYRDTTALPEDETDSVAGSSPELLRRSYTSSETERKREYFVYLPRGYHDEPRKDWPVIFYLHGGGQRGDGRKDLAWVLENGPLYEAWIQKRDLPFVIVAPQLPVFGQKEQIAGRSGQRPPRRLAQGTPPRYEICAIEGGGNWGGDCRIAPHRRAYERTRGEARPIARTGTEAYERVRVFEMEFDYPPEGWPPDGWFRVEEDLIAILDDALAAFRTDTERIYLTGISYGGFGAFDLAASHPARWAALAPLVGTGDLDDAPVLAKTGIPVWMFGGGTDPLIKPHWLARMAHALEEAGHPNVHLTVHEDMAHDVDRRVYAGRDIYDWFLAQSRAERAGGTSASIQEPPLVVEIADLIVVDGNPLEDILALRDVELVVKGGEILVEANDGR